MSESKFSDPSDYFQENAALLTAISTRVGTLIAENPQAGVSIGFDMQTLSVTSTVGAVSTEVLMSENPQMTELEADLLSTKFWSERKASATLDVGDALESVVLSEGARKLRELLKSGMSFDEAEAGLATFEATRPETATVSDAEFIDRDHDKFILLRQVSFYSHDSRPYATSTTVIISDALMKERFYIVQLDDDPVKAIHYHDAAKDELSDQIDLLEPEDQEAIYALVVGGDSASELSFDEQIQPFISKYQSSEQVMELFQKVRARYEQVRASDELRLALGTDLKPSFQSLMELDAYLNGS